MANVQPPSLAAAVSNAGALGTIAGAALSPDELRAAIREVRAATDRAVRRQPLRAAVSSRGRARRSCSRSGRPSSASRSGSSTRSRCRTRGIAVARHGDDGGGGGVPRERGRRRRRRAGRRGGRPSRHVPRLVRGRRSCRSRSSLASIDVAVPVIAAGGIVDGAGIRARARARRVGRAARHGVPLHARVRAAARASRRAAHVRHGRHARVHRAGTCAPRARRSSRS